MSAPSPQMILFFVPEWNGMHPAAWRLPGSPADGAMDFAVVRRLVERAEEAKLHALFLADALGFRLEVSWEALARTANGTRLEPFTLMAALAACTSQIGLILTANTTYDEPYHVARRFASLDHISGGRAGWNVVTGGFSRGAVHFGRDAHVEHGARYARGREFIDAVLDLWDSWEDDAFVRDQASGQHFDPAKLHVVSRTGRHVACTGPLNVARPPQGHPVIAQAGSSPTGRAFAARYAEVIFTLQGTVEGSRAFRDAVREDVAVAGREPDHVKVLPSLTMVLGASETEAREKAAQLDELADPRVGVELLSAFLETDLSGVPLDGPLPAIERTDQGTQTVQRFFAEKARREQLTIRQLIPSALGFGSIVGTPRQLADHMEAWLRGGAADGFNVTFADMPGSLDLFVDELVPELRRRGLFRDDYCGRTLRENLGLPRPVNSFATA